MFYAGIGGRGGARRIVVRYHIMIRIYRNLYVSDKVKDAGDIVARIRRGEPVSGVRLVTMPAARKEGEQFAHMSAGMLKQPLLRRQDLYVIGLAAGYRDANELAARIVGEAYAVTGTPDVRAYLFPEGMAETSEEDRSGAGSRWIEAEEES